MNKLNGDIEINNIIVNSETEKKDFFNAFHSYFPTSNANDNMFLFKDSVLLNGIKFWVVVNFRHDKIYSIELENAEEELKNSYDCWSNDKATKKKNIHDEWLVQLLGKPTSKKNSTIIYKENWGEVISFSDPKSGQIEILIVYGR